MTNATEGPTYCLRCIGVTQPFRRRWRKNSLFLLKIVVLNGVLRKTEPEASTVYFSSGSSVLDNNEVLHIHEANLIGFQQFCWFNSFQSIGKVVRILCKYMFAFSTTQTKDTLILELSMLLLLKESQTIIFG